MKYQNTKFATHRQVKVGRLRSPLHRVRPVFMWAGGPSAAVVKYRRKVEPVAARIREIGEYISPNYNITFLEFNHDQDHVHILFSAHSNKENSLQYLVYKCLKCGKTFVKVTPGGTSQTSCVVHTYLKI